VQAETNKATDTNTTRMIQFHQAGAVFEAGNIAVSSGYALPSALVAFEADTHEEPSLPRFIPAGATRHIGRAMSSGPF
jgi:hypothetical protein